MLTITYKALFLGEKKSFQSSRFPIKGKDGNSCHIPDQVAEFVQLVSVRACAKLTLVFVWETIALDGERL